MSTIDKLPFDANISYANRDKGQKDYEQQLKIPRGMGNTEAGIPPQVSSQSLVAQEPLIVQLLEINKKVRWSALEAPPGIDTLRYIHSRDEDSLAADISTLETIGAHLLANLPSTGTLRVRQIRKEAESERQDLIAACRQNSHVNKEIQYVTNQMGSLLGG